MSTKKKAVLKEPINSRKISDTSVVDLVIGWREVRQSDALFEELEIGVVVQ